MKKFKLNKKVIISLLLVLTVFVTGALAVLVATDSEENVFTVGKIDIELNEPNWSEEDGKNIVPNETIAKDPQLENTGENNAYVYMLVSVPKADNIGFRENGVTTTQNDVQLFGYEVNPGWSLMDSKIDSDDKYNYYLYKYDAVLAPGNSTSPVFSEVKFADIAQDQLVSGQEVDIKVKGYAIQSDFYNNEATDAASAWQLYVNQNDWIWPSEPVGPHYSLVSYDGEIVQKIPIPVGATEITLPDSTLTSAFPTDVEFVGWATESELSLSSGDTVTLESLYVRDVSDNIINEYPIITEVVATKNSNNNTEDDHLPVKLVPLNEDSTAMINRGAYYTVGTGLVYNGPFGGKIESYNDGFEVITNEYGYETPDNYDEWFVYGLDEKVTTSVLFDEYVKVQGDGYAIVKNKLGPFLGSGSTIEVYDRHSTKDTADDTLVERFYIVIIGDISGDGMITGFDVELCRLEIGYVSDWSFPGTYVSYKYHAAEAADDGVISTVDCTTMREVIGGLTTAKEIQCNYFVPSRRL